MPETAPAKIYVNQPSSSPSRKVSAGALAGAFSILFVYLVKTFAHQDIPGEAASAITTVFTFLVSYMVRDSE